MAIDFPNSPSNNDIYTVNGKRWIYSSGKWSIYGSTAPDATASDTEPTGVGDGHIWYRSDQSQTLIRYDNTWVEVGSAGGFDSSSTSFPTSLDSATGFAAVEALQAKVGVNSSAVTTSLDYKVAQLEAVSHGKILQVVSTTKTDTWSGSVTGDSFGGSNIPGLEVTITPTSATSKVLIICLLHATHNSYGQANYRLVRNGSAVGVADAAGNRPQLTSGLQPSDITSATATPQMNMGAHYLDSPASTSALTYGVQLYNVNPTGTFYVNRTQNDADSTSRGRWVSTITAMEVSA